MSNYHAITRADMNKMDEGKLYELVCDLRDKKDFKAVMVFEDAVNMLSSKFGYNAIEIGEMIEG